MKTKKSGFTLIEILVVISIISVLASMVLPALFGVINKKSKMQAQTNCDNIKQAINRFRADNKIYPWAYNTPNMSLASMIDATAAPAGAITLELYDDGMRALDPMATLIGNPAGTDASTTPEPLTSTYMGEEGFPFEMIGKDSDGENENRILDPWGVPFRIIINRKTKEVTVQSAGEDGIFDYMLSTLGVEEGGIKLTDTDDVISN